MYRGPKQIGARASGMAMAFCLVARNESLGCNDNGMVTWSASGRVCLNGARRAAVRVVGEALGLEELVEASTSLILSGPLLVQAELRAGMWERKGGYCSIHVTVIMGLSCMRPIRLAPTSPRRAHARLIAVLHSQHRRRFGARTQS
jgi:hypothetical protein